MKIPLRTLKKVLTIKGHTFLGRRAEVTLHPSHQPGMYWKVGNAIIPIDYNIAKNHSRWIELHYMGNKLMIVEHFLALKILLGLSCIIETKEMPYFPTGGMVANLITPHLKVVGTKTMDWILPKNSQSWEYSSPPFHSVSFSPSRVGLVIVVEICFPRFGGKHKYTFNLSDISEHKNVLESRPLAFPSSVYLVGRMARSLGWPHFDGILWPQETNEKYILSEIAHHRVLDILGALALVPRGIPAIEYHSHRAGHRADMGVIPQTTWSRDLSDVCIRKMSLV